MKYIIDIPEIPKNDKQRWVFANGTPYEERPHGEWIKHIDDLFPEESTEECSVCHEEQRITGNDDNFCPYCGALMSANDEQVTGKLKEGDEK